MAKESDAGMPSPCACDANDARVDTDRRILAVAQPIPTELPLRTQPNDSTFEYAALSASLGP